MTMVRDDAFLLSVLDTLFYGWAACYIPSLKSSFIEPLQSKERQMIINMSQIKPKDITYFDKHVFDKHNEVFSFGMCF